MLNSLIEQAADVNTHPDVLRKLALQSIELARLVAENPSSPSDILLVLSIFTNEREIRRSLTRNPNMPVEELISLSAYFPYELMNNQTFRLLLLENPNLFQKLPVQTVKNILLLDDVLPEYLVMAASSNHIDILTIVANHPKAPKYLLHRIINRIKMSESMSMNKTLDNIAYVASQNVQFAGEITEGWDEEIWQAIQKYTLLYPQKEKEIFIYDVGILDKRMLLNLSFYTHLKIIAKSENFLAIAELLLDALNPEIKATINLSQPGQLDTNINALLKSTNPKIIKILTAIAENPNSPLFILEKLALINSLEIKQAIYRNYNTPDSILKILFKIDSIQSNLENPQNIRKLMLSSIMHYHSFQYSPHLIYSDIDNICKLLFLSDTIDNDIYQKLKNIPSFDILIALARQSKKPAYIFDHVYKKSQYYKTDSPGLKNIKKTIKILLAKSPQVPLNILFNLVEDEDYQVAKEAINNLKNHLTANNQQITEFLEKWEQANNPATSQDILSNIAYSSNVALAFAVANNPGTSAQTLHQLAVDLKGDVLIAVANNPNASLTTILTLCGKSKGSLNIRAHAVKVLIQKYPSGAGAILAEVVNSDKPTSARFILLLHPIAPPEFLAYHADSISWIERYAVAQNTSTPADVLSKLSTDANRLVRATALARLQAS